MAKKTAPPQKVNVVELAGVSSLTARITPMGFALVLTGHTLEEKVYLLELRFDWSWFPVLAEKLNDLLDQRDAITLKFRDRLWGNKE